jgi:hypothetical protein
MRPSAKTLILLYTDAPSHAAGNAHMGDSWKGHPNERKETEA